MELSRPSHTRPHPRRRRRKFHFQGLRKPYWAPCRRQAQTVRHAVETWWARSAGCRALEPSALWGGRNRPGLSCPESSDRGECSRSRRASTPSRRRSLAPIKLQALLHLSFEFAGAGEFEGQVENVVTAFKGEIDRKSTRLNSS